MIIVSQSKRLILNFENLTAVGISGLEDGSIAIKIYEENDKRGTTIARYATEERAKEVLQEIYQAYSVIELVNIPDMEFERIITSDELKECIAYKMPKE